ncbi:MAG: 3-hydroxyanthranilate 3,4-dioxygenase [Alphaproteobacteria bacterium]|jgi:3-hydroxyanthranilate 3,4-dioxygenase
MTGIASFNLKGWIDENRHLLKPPMLGKPVWRDHDFIVMILAGPIARNDYHINPHEEFFYQLEGNMTLKVVEDGAIKDIPIPEGNVFLMPPGIPHSPQRPEPGSIGLVVERHRTTGDRDAFEWYCETCCTPVHRCELQLADFVTERDRLFDEYYDGIAKNGVCKGCGEPMPGRVGS